MRAFREALGTGPGPGAARWVAAAVITCGVLAAHAGPGAGAGRGTGATVAAPRVRFVPIAAFDSLRIPGFGAWSPRGQRLALMDSTTRICVFDAARPERPPRVVVDARAWVRSFSWSPDGEWLLVLAGDPRPDNQVVLLAVAVDGGRRDTLRAQSELWPAVWGPDGRIHYRSGRRRFTLDAPAGWVPSAGTSLHDPPVLEVADDLSLRFRHWSPGPGEEQLLPGTEVTVGGVVRVRLVDQLPDGSRALVGVSRDTVAHWRIVDADGGTLTDLRRAGIAFQPTTLSADGRLVAGFSGRWEGEAGWTRTELRIADANGAWVAPIEGTGDGMGPQLSRTGTLVAFSGGESGGTRVGRLVVTPR